MEVDTCLPFSCKLYNVVIGKEPRLWNCSKSSCLRAFLDTRNPLEPSHVKTALSWGTRGIVLLSSQVWKDVNGWALEIGISCTYSNPVVTGGRKHTHTNKPTQSNRQAIQARPPGTLPSKGVHLVPAWKQPQSTRKMPNEAATKEVEAQSQLNAATSIHNFNKAL
jgi:hypothetical protein